MEIEFTNGQLFDAGVRNHWDRWLISSNIAAGTFADHETWGEPVLYREKLRREIADWLQERRVNYRLYRKLIVANWESSSGSYEGFFIHIGDPTHAVEFKLRWF